jgi:spermidine synthase
MKSNSKKSLKKSGHFSILLVSCITVFVSNFCIMAIELVASRLIARHLGSSLYTWTSVIGVVLAGIAIGNYLGGRIADRFQPRKTLVVLFGLCSIGSVVTIILNNLIGNWDWLWYLSWPNHIFSHVSLVFLLPSILLGTISPVVAKMALDVGLPTGRTVGDIYAWGAAGSIVGTFVTGYWLIATMGTISIIWMVGAVLLLMAVLYQIRSWPLYILAAVFFSFWVIGMAPGQWCQNTGATLALRKEPDPRIIYEDESQYSYIAVKQIQEKPDVRAFVLDWFTHTSMAMDDVLNLQSYHHQIFATLTSRLNSNNEKLSVMVIGGAGYAFPRYIEKIWPGSQIDVVEIDAAVTHAAKQAFGLSKDSSIKSIAMDGRNYVDELLRRNINQRINYDFIYQDAISDFTVPFQLVTREFNEKVNQLLSDKGVYVSQILDTFDSGLVLGATINTVEKTFPYVDVFSTSEMPHKHFAIFIIVAANKQFNFEAIGKERENKNFKIWHLTESDIQSVKDKAGGIVLSDNYAPLENFLTPIVRLRGINRMAAKYMKHAEQLVQEGKFNESVAIYEKVLDLKPEIGQTVYARIGSILIKMGDFEKATEILQKALNYDSWSLSPVRSEQIHLDMVTAFQKSGDSKEAGKHINEAAKEYRHRLLDNPESIELQNNLAWLLATNKEAKLTSPNEAIDLAQNACRQTYHKNPYMLDTLAAAYAAATRFSEAVTTAEKASDIAQSIGNSQLANAIRSRLQLYETGSSYSATMNEKTGN